MNSAYPHNIEWSGQRQFHLDPHDPHFFEHPSPAYQLLHQRGGPLYWEDYQLWCLTSFEAVNLAFRDKRLARLPPAGYAAPTYPPHLDDFKAVERYSLLCLEPPEHTMIRKRVNRAFASSQINRMAAQIETLAHQCIDKFEHEGEVDLLAEYATPIPLTVIARLLGVPEQFGPQLLAWSHAMVKVYTMTQTQADEVNANQAAVEFRDFIKDQLAHRRQQAGDDLLTHLIDCSDADNPSADDEIVSVAILLLNAGHEATVHQIGNAVHSLLQADSAKHAAGTDRRGTIEAWLAPENIDNTVTECLRHDAPLHLFTRYAQQDIELGDGVRLPAGEQVALLLGAANHDPARFHEPQKFIASRKGTSHVSLGAGIHFCVGAVLARLEMTVALRVLFERLPDLQLTAEPSRQDSYHFHGFKTLHVTW